MKNQTTLTFVEGSDVIDFLLAPDTIVFSAAIVLMFLIGLVEAVGLGGSGIDVDSDGLLTWLGVGRVPLLILLVAFLACFGLIGLIGQQLLASMSGYLVPTLIAVPASLAAALPVTALAARGLARIMPHDETTAIDLEDLVGRSATIEIGIATCGSPARAKVIDHFGQGHFIMVEPDNADQRFEQGDQVLLVRREASIFRAIISERPQFSNWINS